MKLKLKRVYEAASGEDGFRILVDRLWPRGVTREAARIDLWLKDAAPSPELRKWFNHESDKWDPFRASYLGELMQHPEKVALIREHAGKGRVTLVYGARDAEHNHALVLKEFLMSDKQVP
ncbi:DUF488 domain-containing protein [Noviherbaspirillum sedimenti]|uniref:DUF488 family protein n=1 Tax=Noviherbaspirillum sedimenti TaxID=2320865 RepID=A0A3A3GMB2_9BURK|nr:DUF488 family protein [Noviherbaspirillum sedimenti]RJG03436.1 DUF488 family protein [Noviherbaspirillum sedimenti]